MRFSRRNSSGDEELRALERAAATGDSVARAKLARLKKRAGMSGGPSRDYLKRFLDGYLDAALWSSNDESDESGGRPLDENYTRNDVAPEARRAAVRYCVDFVRANWNDLRAIENRRDAEHAGHDFWLTRNGHGTGFWDRGLGAVGDRLSKASKVYGEVNLYVGDNGLVHSSEEARGTRRNSRARENPVGGLMLVVGNPPDCNPPALLAKYGPSAERWWEESKRQALKQGLDPRRDGDRFWRYVHGIVKRRAAYAAAKKQNPSYAGMQAVRDITFVKEFERGKRDEALVEFMANLTRQTPAQVVEKPDWTVGEGIAHIFSRSTDRARLVRIMQDVGLSLRHLPRWVQLPRENPSGDEELRALERRAATGDPSARAALDRMRRRVSPGPVVDEQAIYGLSLVIDNDRMLDRQKQAIEDNLRKKLARGRYDHALAWKLWRYLTTNAVKMLSSQDRRRFTPAVREALARRMADEFEQDPEGLRAPIPLERGQHLSHGNYVVTQKQARALAAAIGKRLPKPGYELLVSHRGYHYFLRQTPHHGKLVWSVVQTNWRPDGKGGMVLRAQGNPSGDDELRALERRAARGTWQDRERLDRARARAGQARECTHCGKLTLDVDDSGDAICKRCYASSLQHGHDQGMHTDGSQDEPVPGCPSCAGGAWEQEMAEQQADEDHLDYMHEDQPAANCRRCQRAGRYPQRRVNPSGRARADLGDPSPPLKLPRGKVKGRISLEEAIKRNVPGIKEAVARFRKFHGCDPSGDVTVYDDGRKDNVAGFLLGRTPEFTYDDVPAGSNKAGNPWVHKTSKKKPTYLVHIPLTEQTVTVGHTKVTDWMREPDEKRRH